MGGRRNWQRVMSRESFNISSEEPCVSATRYLVNWSFKQRVINENIRRKPLCYEYRASSNVEFLAGYRVITTAVCVCVWSCFVKLSFEWIGHLIPYKGIWLHMNERGDWITRQGMSLTLLPHPLPKEEISGRLWLFHCIEPSRKWRAFGLTEINGAVACCETAYSTSVNDACPRKYSHRQNTITLYWMTTLSFLSIGSRSPCAAVSLCT